MNFVKLNKNWNWKKILTVKLQLNSNDFQKNFIETETDLISSTEISLDS